MVKKIACIIKSTKAEQSVKKTTPVKNYNFFGFHHKKLAKQLVILNSRFFEAS
jgi:hypothetical protein